MMTVGSWRDGSRWVADGAALVAGTHIALVSLDRNTYFVYRESERTNWHHPTGFVSIILFCVILEGVAAHMVFDLRKPGPLRMRAVAALALLIPWALILSTAVMHAPGFYILHALWVWVLVAALLLGWATSCVAGLVARVRARRGRAPNAQEPA